MEYSPQSSGRSRTASFDIETSNILRHKIVVEKEVFGVLDVQIDGTDTGTEVAIQTDAVLGDLISLHGDNGIVFSSRRIINSSSLVVFEN